MRFASFLSGEITTMAVINPQEKKLAKRTLCAVGPTALETLMPILHFICHIWRRRQTMDSTLGTNSHDLPPSTKTGRNMLLLSYASNSIL